MAALMLISIRVDSKMKVNAVSELNVEKVKLLGFHVRPRRS